MVLVITAVAIFAFGIMETSMYFKGDPYYVHIDDLRNCNEQKAIVGDSGRIFCMYREQKVRMGRRSKNAYTYLNYYIFDNASPEDIEKMRADKSYRPENYCVFILYL